MGQIWLTASFYKACMPGMLSIFLNDRKKNLKEYFTTPENYVKFIFLRPQIKLCRNTAMPFICVLSVA